MKVIRISYSLKVAILTALLAKFAVFSVAYASTYFTNGGSTDPGYILLHELVRWDSGQYIRLVNFGYSNQGDLLNGIVFFPLFPFLIRIITFNFDYVNLSGLVISNVSSILAVFYLFRLVKLDYDDGVAKKTILFLCVFPTAYFMSAVFSESLFLALIIASLYYARQSKWPLAGFLGLLSCLTRITGLIIIPTLFIEYLYQTRWTGKLNWEKVSIAADSGAIKNDLTQLQKQSTFVSLRFKVPGRKLLWSVFPILGFVIYLAINFMVTGNPLTFLAIESKHYYQDLNPLNGWLGAVYRARFSSFPDNLMMGVSQLVFAAFGYLMIGVAYKFKLRPTYQVFMFLTWFLAVSTGFWLSVPRYILVVFPQFIVLGLLSTKKYVNVAIAIFSLACLVYFTWVFGTGQWAF